MVDRRHEKFVARLAPRFPPRHARRARHGGAQNSVGGARAGSGDQAVDFLFSEAGQQARLADDPWCPLRKSSSKGITWFGRSPWSISSRPERPRGISKCNGSGVLQQGLRDRFAAAS
jgi:hypothetical protein